MNNEIEPKENRDQDIAEIAHKLGQNAASFVNRHKRAALIALLTLVTPAPGGDRPSDSERPAMVPDGIEAIEPEISDALTDTNTDSTITSPAAGTEEEISQPEAEIIDLSNKIVKLEKERNPNMVVSVSGDKIRKSGDYVLALVNVVPESSATNEGYGNDDVTTYLYKYSNGDLKPIEVDMEAVTEAVDASIENPDLLDEVYRLRPPEITLGEWMEHLPNLFEYWPGRK